MIDHSYLLRLLHLQTSQSNLKNSWIFFGLYLFLFLLPFLSFHILSYSQWDCIPQCLQRYCKIIWMWKLIFSFGGRVLVLFIMLPLQSPKKDSWQHNVIDFYEYFPPELRAWQQDTLLFTIRLTTPTTIRTESCKISCSPGVYLQCCIIAVPLPLAKTAWLSFKFTHSTHPLTL